MVKYGTTLRRVRRPGWEDAYFDYEELRGIVEQIESRCVDLKEDTNQIYPSIAELEDKFLKKLRTQIEKVSLFALSRQGAIAEAVGALRFQQDSLQIHRLTTASTITPRDARPAHAADDNDAKVDDEIPASDSYGEEEALLPRGSIVSGPILSPMKPSFRKKGNDSQDTMRPLFRDRSLSLPVRRDRVNDRNDDDDDEMTLHRYTLLGVELLHLLRFVCVNAMGIRKMLKKRDKIMLRAQLQQQYSTNALKVRNNDDDTTGFLSVTERLVGGPDDHLQQLANSSSVAAIHSSLLAELEDYEGQHAQATKISDNPGQSWQLEEGNGATSSPSPCPASLVRFQCTVAAVQTLRDYAQRVNQPFQAFLSRRAMIPTDRATKSAMSVLVRFQPDSLLSIDEGALREWEKRMIRRKMTGAFEAGEEGRIGDLNISDNRKSWGGVDSFSMTINLLSTLLYTVNYYIVAPTANHYAILLGTDGAFGATLVGASSFAAIFAAFLYSLWYTRSSFRSALLVSALCPCIGNLLYSLAISYKSMPIALWGRILVGFGSAEVVNRQLISACVSFQNMTEASALFVAAGAIGMSVGPLLAAILDITSGHDVRVDLELPFLPSGGIIYNHVTSPGYVMACLWFLEILLLLFVFSEPERINAADSNKRVVVPFAADGGEFTEYGTSALSDSKAQKESQPKPGAWKTFWFELVRIQNLIFSNMALPVTLLLFGFIELTDEVLISSCSMVCRRYFSWNGSHAGFLIASLGALVLPAHYVVERASRYYTERRIMISSVLFICASLFAILNYEGLIFDLLGLAAESVSASTDQIEVNANGTHTVDISIGGTSVEKVLNNEGEVPYDWGAGKGIYISFLSAVFMGTIILEGVDTSIMAKATPPKLNDTFINSGLLATLVGTVGRVLGDSMITLSAIVDQDIFTDFVNATFFPMIPLAFIGFCLIHRFYGSLQ